MTVDDPENESGHSPAGAAVRVLNLKGVRVAEGDLTGAVLRGLDLAGAEIDSPWLFEGGSTLLVNGVDVVPFVDAELNRRFPGRELRLAADPAGLRAAWAAVEAAWASALDRAAALPEGTVDESVDGEWSFAQTLRHLVMAIDTWLGRAILRREQPYHPLGQPNREYAEDGYDTSVFAAGVPAYDQVLAVREDRVVMVRDFLASISEEDLAQVRQNPWASSYEETVLSCLHTILGEEWEHLRYALRDLDALAGRSAPGH